MKDNRSLAREERVKDVLFRGYQMSRLALVESCLVSEAGLADTQVLAIRLAARRPLHFWSRDVGVGTRTSTSRSRPTGYRNQRQPSASLASGVEG